MLSETGMNQQVPEQLVEASKDVEDDGSDKASMSANKNPEGEKDQEKTTMQNLERFVQRIRMYAHQIIQGTFSEFNPDDDSFVMDKDAALRLHKNTNMLQFVRRSLMA